MGPQLVSRLCTPTEGRGGSRGGPEGQTEGWDFILVQGA